MKRLLLSAACSALFLAACSDKPVTTDPGPGLKKTDEGTTLPIDHPTVDIPDPISSAQPQRMSVRQLRGSFPVVVGNDVDGGVITWKVGATNGLDVYNDTLGEADYINVTNDNLEPSPLYLKFMDDAARDVCSRVLNADWVRTVDSDRQFIRFVSKTDTVTSNPGGVDNNLRYLKLRYHAIKVTNDSEIAGLRKLFTDVDRKSVV